MPNLEGNILHLLHLQRESQVLCKPGKAVEGQVKLPVLQVLHPTMVRDLHVGRSVCRTAIAGGEMTEYPLNTCAVLYLFWSGAPFPGLSPASPASSLGLAHHLPSQIHAGGYLVALLTGVV